MPVTTRKEDGGYTNTTPGGVKGRHMTKGNAEAQARLLRAIDYGWKPTDRNEAAKKALKGKKK